MSQRGSTGSITSHDDARRPLRRRRRHAPHFHAVDLDSGREVEHHADAPVVTASVFKLPVLVELCRQHAVGEIDASDAGRPCRSRAARPAPIGLSVMRDPVTMSLRDLAWLMMGISDNAATDFLCARGRPRRRSAPRYERLGLTSTRIDGDCRDLFQTIYEDLDVDETRGGRADLGDGLAKLRAIDPERTLHRHHPARHDPTLLRLVWDDEAAPPEACAEVRRILGLQVWPHRLASGFADDDDDQDQRQDRHAPDDPQRGRRRGVPGRRPLRRRRLHPRPLARREEPRGRRRHRPVGPVGRRRTCAEREPPSTGSRDRRASTAARRGASAERADGTPRHQRRGAGRRAGARGHASASPSVKRPAAGRRGHPVHDRVDVEDLHRHGADGVGRPGRAGARRPRRRPPSRLHACWTWTSPRPSPSATCSTTPVAGGATCRSTRRGATTRSTRALGGRRRPRRRSCRWARWRPTATRASSWPAAWLARRARHAVRAGRARPRADPLGADGLVVLPLGGGAPPARRRPHRAGRHGDAGADLPGRPVRSGPPAGCGARCATSWRGPRYHLDGTDRPATAPLPRRPGCSCSSRRSRSRSRHRRHRPVVAAQAPRRRAPGHAWRQRLQRAHLDVRPGARARAWR